MKEMLDIYNDKLEKIGVKSRNEVHKNGLKHKVVQCFIMKKDQEDIWLYFQKRALDKDSCPGMYDIACAGHVDAGEEALDSMKRELIEEVGIKADDEKLKYVGTKFENYKKDGLIDDEICEIYILKVEDDCVFNMGEEVTDIVKVNFALYRKWTKNEMDSLKAVSLSNNEEIELNSINSCPHIREDNETLMRAILEI